MIQFIDEDNPDHIVVCFPSLLLLQQFYNKYVKKTGIEAIFGADK